jgi:hypothetical protein
MKATTPTELEKIDFKKKDVTISRENFANLFTIGIDKDNYRQYLINRSMYFSNVDNYPPKLLKYYTIQAKDTWTLISYKFYGTIELWWIVCKLNGIINPLEFPEAGTIIKILDQTYVTSILQDMK